MSFFTGPLRHVMRTVILLTVITGLALVDCSPKNSADKVGLNELPELKRLFLAHCQSPSEGGSRVSKSEAANQAIKLEDTLRRLANSRPESTIFFRNETRFVSTLLIIDTFRGGVIDSLSELIIIRRCLDTLWVVFPLCHILNILNVPAIISIRDVKSEIVSVFGVETVDLGEPWRSQYPPMPLETPYLFDTSGIDKGTLTVSLALPKDSICEVSVLISGIVQKNGIEYRYSAQFSASALTSDTIASFKVPTGIYSIFCRYLKHSNFSIYRAIYHDYKVKNGKETRINSVVSDFVLRYRIRKDCN